MRRKYLIILVAGLLWNSGVDSQVTIGSSKRPLPGALLMLDDGTTGVDGVNASRGLGMPRVKLTDMHNLYPMFTGAETDYAALKIEHTGLTLYNVSGAAIPKCAPIPDGLYVWDGAKWQGVGVAKAQAISLNVGPVTHFNLPSGIDLRPLVAQTFNVAWSPANPLGYVSTPTNGNAISFSSITPSPLTSSPTTFSMLPSAMAVDPTNPFQTKETSLTFSASNECGEEIKTITLNQTNKALTIDGSSTPPTISAEVVGNGSKTADLASNASWKLSELTPAVNSAISDVKLNAQSLVIGSPYNWERNDNMGNNGNLTYTITTGANIARYSKLVFSSTESTKNFADVTINILQCSNLGQNPTMSEWAAIAGFVGVASTKISDTDDQAKKIDIANPNTGIAWHRDQNGNVFLSSSFHPTDITGDSERWMITNLEAVDFDRRVPRTGDDVDVLQNFGNSPSAVNNALTPLWSYPKVSATVTPGEAASSEFINNPRLGRLYNWAAATNSRGNTTNGLLSITDGENMSITRPKIQGICPNGWYLPNDAEWTALERELNSNTMTYSSATANANGTIVTGQVAQRGLRDNANGHANAMKDPCEVHNGGSTKGTSNPISTVNRPGFEGQFAGSAYSGSAWVYALRAYFWTASGNGTFAWLRDVSNTHSEVNRFNSARYIQYSVRCKK